MVCSLRQEVSRIEQTHPMPGDVQGKDSTELRLLLQDLLGAQKRLDKVAQMQCELIALVEEELQETDGSRVCLAGP